MKDFDLVRFKGAFRSYQQSVLDNSGRFLEDGKIHIVAAPGSGKTVLGIELIRRLNAPALIFSPSVIIRQQWGERFAESFLPEGHEPGEYISNDLKKPELLTSVTYQTLYAAYNRISVSGSDNSGEAGDEENNAENNDSVIDFSDFDLLAAIKKAGIRTICLDEAHHLKNEWQRALEAFIKAIQSQVTVISLTATPPYDSTQAAWKRYISLCGEIDDEIFVPELVQQGTLCPHQDYIYFNYPQGPELEEIREYRERTANCISRLCQSDWFSRVLDSSCILTDFGSIENRAHEYSQGYIALLCLAKYAGYKIPLRVMWKLRRTLPRFSAEQANNAFQLILDHPEFFGDGLAGDLKTELRRDHLLKLKQVCFIKNEKVSRSLISSIGKLNSIATIARAEYSALGGGLRMLVLTDHIRKDLIGIVGSERNIETMGTVPVFEKIRRAVGRDVDIALLSGSLVLWPNSKIDALRNIAEKQNVAFSANRLGDNGYSAIAFSGNNRNKVAVVTKAFQDGVIQILVGTSALLGEGWDSPCINSLILASFVGSFVLSNQMRGRAIRTVAGNPDKTANIWHLVTAEQPHTISDNPISKVYNALFSDNSSLAGEDYELVKRRFGCFLAPAYNSDVIESGIERVDILQPPYSKENIERIDEKMLLLASDRAGIAARWNAVLRKSDAGRIVEQTKIPKKRIIPMVFLFENALLLAILLAIETIFLSTFNVKIKDPDAGIFLDIIANAAMAFFISRVVMIISRFLSPAASVRTLANCILKSLRSIGEIKSGSAKVFVNNDKTYGQQISCVLKGATVHEQSIFGTAVSEMLSAIDNPRYVIVKKSRFLFVKRHRYSQSYACPSVIGAKKENADTLAKNLRKVSGAFGIYYTRTEHGRRMLLECQKKSYINRNESYIFMKHRVDTL